MPNRLALQRGVVERRPGAGLPGHLQAQQEQQDHREGDQREFEGDDAPALPEHEANRPPPGTVARRRRARRRRGGRAAARRLRGIRRPGTVVPKRFRNGPHKKLALGLVLWTFFGGGRPQIVQFRNEICY
jgi:hypothetical protein